MVAYRGRPCPRSVVTSAALAARLAALLLVGLVLAACRVDATVDVQVADDGSGDVAVDVVLDADAVARVPDLASSLRTEDLTAAGWTVDAPAVDAEGAVTVRAEKPFATPEQLPAVLCEITTAFDDLTLERRPVLRPGPLDARRSRRRDRRRCAVR